MRVYLHTCVCVSMCERWGECRTIRGRPPLPPQNHYLRGMPCREMEMPMVVSRLTSGGGIYLCGSAMLGEWEAETGFKSQL